MNLLMLKISRLLFLLCALPLLFSVNLFAEEKRFVAEVTDGVQHVEVVGGEYFFDPDTIILKVNIPVEMKVKKAAGIVPHDLVVEAPEAGIDLSINLKSDWQVVNFTPTQVGSYRMECHKKLLWFKSHKERGMHGIIEVIP